MVRLVFQNFRPSGCFALQDVVGIGLAGHALERRQHRAERRVVGDTGKQVDQLSVACTAKQTQPSKQTHKPHGNRCRIVWKRTAWRCRHAVSPWGAYVRERFAYLHERPHTRSVLEILKLKQCANQTGNEGDETASLIHTAGTPHGCPYVDVMQRGKFEQQLEYSSA